MFSEYQYKLCQRDRENVILGSMLSRLVTALKSYRAISGMEIGLEARVLGNCSVFVITASMGNDSIPLSPSDLPASENKAVQTYCVCVQRCENCVFLLQVLPSSFTNHTELNFPSFFFFYFRQKSLTQINYFGSW